MNIYSKVTLSVILVITILVSFVFYYFNKEDRPDKDTLFENKIAKHKASGSNKKYGVASNNAIATRVGNKIIEDGGNATDAAIGVSYALAVTEPHSSGLGGGGATLTYNGKDGEEPKMYEYKTLSSYNYKKGDKIGTPGFVQGMHDLHEREGKMDEKKILNYVIPLAEDGFEVDSELERSLKLYGSDIDRDSPFFKGNKTVREGDVVKQPALAKTIKGIRDKGTSFFYKDMAKSVSKQIDNELTEKDLSSFKTEEKKPVSTKYLNNTVYSASNPLGGTLMLQGLKIDESEDASNQRADFINGIVKSRDVMYRNRDIVNGQEASSDTHLSQDYLLDNLNNVNSGGNNGDNSSNFDASMETTSTTHFVVIDKEGKLASTTNTLSSFFGSGKFVKEGFYMNNSLTNFSNDPNSPNYGAKHKAPRSYTAPSIVVGPDFYMGIGTPGGNKIPTILNEVLIDYLRNDGTLQESIDKPRFYNDGGTIYYENAMSDEDINTFKSMGYGVKEKRNDANFGSVQGAIYNKNDKTVEIGHDVGNR